MNRFLILFLFTSYISFSQFSVDATFVPNVASDWAILYKLEGSRKKYVSNAKIFKDTLLVDGNKEVVGKVNFELPLETNQGVYRITYKLEGNSFVDFIFNNENVNFVLHPDYPEQTKVFSDSKENKLYQNYLTEIYNAQKNLDSIQISAIQNPDKNYKRTYKKALAAVKKTQQIYTEASNGMYVQPFIIANSRANPTTIATTAKEYMDNLNTNFFKNIDFSNKTLLNSSFLIDRFIDYIFYVNISDDIETQQLLYKKSIKKVVSKINNSVLKKDAIEFITSQFAEKKNLHMVDYLFDNYYDEIPDSVKNKEFKTELLKTLATEVGRKAPNFVWNEDEERMSLKTLDEAENYLLVFWSSTCSHCLKEIPKLHAFLKDYPSIKVIAFSLERDKFTWNEIKKDLEGWHHVLGLNKWQNKVARTYNINSTPSYFILDNDKTIIAKPEHFIDVTDFINKM